MHQNLMVNCVSTYTINTILLLFNWYSVSSVVLQVHSIELNEFLSFRDLYNLEARQTPAAPQHHAEVHQSYTTPSHTDTVYEGR